MMNDIMVDLETMDNVPSANIVSIGAVQCNLITGELGEEYYRVVDLEGQKGTINSKTLYWWMGQSDAAREALVVDGKLFVNDMCKTFSKWLLSIDPSGEKLKLWGNGASFDNAIIRQTYRYYGYELPIKFWNDRDMRTIVGFYPKQLQEKWRRTTLRKGTHHNALDDAKQQVVYCSHILQELGVKELY
jgi:exodeoxyribonuclease VIII